MLIKKIGVGTISLLLSIIGIVWAFALNGVCVGDNVLNSLGLAAWSNGNTGTHFTVYYSLIFFIPAFFLAIKYNGDFGAKAGKIVSSVIGVFVVLSTFWLAV